MKKSALETALESRAAQRRKDDIRIIPVMLSVATARHHVANMRQGIPSPIGPSCVDALRDAGIDE